jgi:hypothetical protein
MIRGRRRNGRPIHGRPEVTPCYDPECSSVDAIIDDDGNWVCWRCHLHRLEEEDDDDG